MYCNVINYINCGLEGLSKEFAQSAIDFEPAIVIRV